MVSKPLFSGRFWICSELNVVVTWESVVCNRADAAPFTSTCVVAVGNASLISFKLEVAPAFT
jgi:hypothetical protein